MKIQDLLQKPVWTRRQQNDYTTAGTQTTTDGTMTTMTLDTGNNFYYTQKDFMDELYSSAHKINSSIYRSMRKKYKFNITTNKFEFDTYEDVERSPIAAQWGIRRHKVTSTFGNDLWFGSLGKKKDEKNDQFVATFKSYWEQAGMKDALSVWGSALFGTADAGLYMYLNDDKQVEYKVFSYEDGDVVHKTKDDKGDDIFIRLFTLGGKNAVEIYGVRDIQLWIQTISETDAEIIAVTKILAWVKGQKGTVSDDGYTLIKTKAHNYGRCPVIYFRLSDVVWGNGQKTIENIEKSLSDLRENNKYYAYQIMFLSGGVMSLPDAEQMGKVIASKSENGKAEILAPADASDTFTTELEKNLKLLWWTLGMTVLSPDEIKAGENSGAFIQNLYWPEIQWSKNMIAYLRPALREIVSMFTQLVGLAESDATGYKNMRMMFSLSPCAPRNTTEEIINICTAKNAGLTSQQTGAEEIDFNNSREYDRLKEEKAEQIQMDEQKADADAKRTAETRPEGQLGNKQAQGNK
jgi:hypothetical protein